MAHIVFLLESNPFSHIGLSLPGSYFIGSFLCLDWSSIDICRTDSFSFRFPFKSYFINAFLWSIELFNHQLFVMLSDFTAKSLSLADILYICLFVMPLQPCKIRLNSAVTLSYSTLSPEPVPTTWYSTCTYCERECIKLKH